MKGLFENFFWSDYGYLGYFFLNIVALISIIIFLLGNGNFFFVAIFSLFFAILFRVILAEKSILKKINNQKDDKNGL